MPHTLRKPTIRRTPVVQAVGVIEWLSVHICMSMQIALRLRCVYEINGENGGGGANCAGARLGLGISKPWFNCNHEILTQPHVFEQEILCPSVEISNVKSRVLLIVTFFRNTCNELRSELLLKVSPLEASHSDLSKLERRMILEVFALYLRLT